MKSMNKWPLDQWGRECLVIGWMVETSIAQGRQWASHVDGWWRVCACSIAWADLWSCVWLVPAATSQQQWIVPHLRLWVNISVSYWRWPSSDYTHDRLAWFRFCFGTWRVIFAIFHTSDCSQFYTLCLRVASLFSIQPGHGLKPAKTPVPGVPGLIDRLESQHYLSGCHYPIMVT